MNGKLSPGSDLRTIRARLTAVNLTHFPGEATRDDSRSIRGTSLSESPNQAVKALQVTDEKGLKRQ